MSKPSFETWLKEAEIDIDDNVIIITAETEFAADWIANRYSSLILDTVKELTGQAEYDIKVNSHGNGFVEISPQSISYSTTLAYDELKSPVSKQSDLIKQLQEKTDVLEKRVIDLEQLADSSQ